LKIAGFNPIIMPLRTRYDLWRWGGKTSYLQVPTRGQFIDKMISNPVQGICHPRLGIDICLHLGSKK
jgi:hypothetical protein